jgi:hypothetical protein
MAMIAARAAHAAALDNPVSALLASLESAVYGSLVKKDPLAVECQV